MAGSSISWRFAAFTIRAIGPSAQFLAVGLAGLCGMIPLGGLVTGAALSAPVAIAAVAFCGALGLALIALRRSYPHDAIGWCNVVTLGRLMLTAALLGALLSASPSAWTVFALAVIAFALDGADGWLARREGYTSTFGARFDVEVDSALALILAVHAFQHAGVGAYVILLGLPRYLFVIAQVALPWMRHTLPERFSRKVVCVVQISALILVLVPGVGAAAAAIAAGVAALALMWSFALDLRWLWMARA